MSMTAITIVITMVRQSVEINDIEFRYNQRDLHCVYVAGTANCL